MTSYLVFVIIIGIFAVITLILSCIKNSEGYAEVSGWLGAIAVVCLLAHLYAPSNEKTPIAIGTSPEIITLGIGFALPAIIIALIIALVGAVLYFRSFDDTKKGK